MIESKPARKLAGLLMFVAGTAGTVWCWYSMPTEGPLDHYLAGVFPFLAIAGLGSFLFPIDLDCLRDEHGVDQPTMWSHLPISTKIFLVIGAVSGIGYWLVVQ